MVQIEQDILSANNRYADDNRRYFGERGMLALNLVSSPGSGKTMLLTETILRLKDELNIAVIEGDQQTARDATASALPVCRQCRSIPARAATWTRIESATRWKALICRRKVCCLSKTSVIWSARRPSIWARRIKW